MQWYVRQMNTSIESGDQKKESGEKSGICVWVGGVCVCMHVCAH